MDFSAIAGFDKIRILGILGSKKVSDLVASDVTKLAGVLKYPLSEDEASGLLSLVQQPEVVTQSAVNYLMKMVDDGTFAKFLSPGASARPELDLGNDDYLSRCPECHNPELLDLRELDDASTTNCPHCFHTYKVEVAA